MRAIGRIAERIFVVVVFCALSGSLERLRYSLLTPTIMEGLTWLLLGIAVVLIVVCFATASVVIADLWPNLLVVALVILSASWSIEPNLTLSRALSLVALSGFAIYVAARFSLLEQLDLLLGALFLVALYTLVALLFVPGTVEAPSLGGVHGWFTHKNHLGRCMSLAILTAEVAAVVPGRRVMAIVASTFCLGLLIVSGSRSAMLSALVCVGGFRFLCLMQRNPRRARSLLGIFTAAAIVFGFFVVRNSESVFAWMGRDATLNMRTTLWRVLIDLWAQRPWLGFGYGAFWRGKIWPSGKVIGTLQYNPWHAHNGFLEFGLELGVIGLVAFVIILFSYGRRALRLGRNSRVKWALWPAMYLSFFVLSNLTESELVRHDSLYWVVYLIAAAQVGPLSRGSAGMRG